MVYRVYNYGLHGLRSLQELVGLQEIQGAIEEKFSGSLGPMGVTGLLCEKIVVSELS